MARLFIGQREVDFMSDITKEIVKDIAGQKIYYYTVRADLSNVHDIYEESFEKIFNPPIEIECAVEWQPQELRTTNFGTDKILTVSVFLHHRDLLDKNIDFKQGDYFSYGQYFFEATSLVYDKIVFGHIERIVSVKVIGKQTRIEHINKTANGPTSESYSDSIAIQTTFEQQRGLKDDDIRQLKKDKVLEQPITGAKKVMPDGTIKSINGIGSSFYGDE